MTSPTSARKTPTKSFKSWCPQDAHQVMISPGLLTFWYTFFHIKICLRTGSRGTPHFPIFFNARLSYLKQYCRYQCPKSGPNRWRRTDGRTPDERTDAHQNFEASCTKALRAIIILQSDHRQTTKFLSFFIHGIVDVDHITGRK